MNAHENSDSDGKLTNFILDSGSNTSFILPDVRISQRLTNNRPVTTQNGAFRTKMAARVSLKTNKTRKQAEVLVHPGLPHNLLSVTPIVEELGALLLDKRGAALLKRSEYDKVKRTLQYFAIRRNKLYNVPL